MRRPLAVGLLVAAALVAAGCTSSAGTSTADFKGEAQDVADVVAEFSNDATRRRGKQACDDRLTSAFAEKIAAGNTCASELNKAFKDADGAAIEVDDVKVTGTTATVIVTQDDRNRTVKRGFQLEKVSGNWRISSFG